MVLKKHRNLCLLLQKAFFVVVIPFSKVHVFYPCWLHLTNKGVLQKYNTHTHVQSKVTKKVTQNVVDVYNARIFQAFEAKSTNRVIQSIFFSKYSSIEIIKKTHRAGSFLKSGCLSTLYY